MGVESVNYQCPACGGPLRYDGAKALLVCNHCDSEFALADIEARYAAKQESAEERAQAVAGNAGGAAQAGAATEAESLAPTCARLVQPSLSVMIQPPFPSAPTAETPWLRPGASQEISVPIL